MTLLIWGYGVYLVLLTNACVINVIRRFCCVRKIVFTEVTVVKIIVRSVIPVSVIVFKIIINHFFLQEFAFRLSSVHQDGHYLYILSCIKCLHID